MDAVVVFIIGIYFIYRKKKQVPQVLAEIPVWKNYTYNEDDNAFMEYYHLLIRK